ncbi:hypothetical protein BO70DRAFT_372194 [Aspergillus heteromorphus CBS 117.55]|uniref:TOG domain-containing protein n=1 Tax=Aspergillus heteromorphus CBS 117.55 TaxID=1448321 RepID=A0A317VV09_9EURO|nr:uncharacterized protein BO70DRAFT_372194 [Aspergillus heteromorphus CBS 117.55]PWY77449.1 hypothetical protein BO70DRAFT_372194 [Aspergillus heteromorphus CBS 117.55]
MFSFTSDESLRAYLAFVIAFAVLIVPFKFYLFCFCFVFFYALLGVTDAEAKILLQNMESKAAELVSALKNSNLSIDAKIFHLNGVKSDIKQKNVPEDAVPAIFESSRLSIASQHSSLLSAGFSTLGHLLKRLFIQDQAYLISVQARILYPILLERLGDHKERVRAQAAQAFTDLWPAASADVEHYVLETALVGKNPRAKEMSMIWLSNMTKNHGLLFRSYVSSLVACLEDADSVVRDTAKLTVVELFQNASARAKADLSTKFAEQNVRKSIVNAIIAGIGSTLVEAGPSSRPASRVQMSSSRADDAFRPASRTQKSTVEAGPSSRPASRVQLPSSRADDTILPVSRAQKSTVEPEQPLRPVSRVQKRIVEPEQPLRPVSRAQKPAVESEQPLRPASRAHKPALESEQPSRPVSRVQKRPASRADGNTAQAEAASRPSSSDSEKVVPINVTSSRHIDDMVRTMSPHFEGRETEENWLHREKSVIDLRRLTHGNAPQAFPQAFIAAMKTLLDGIFKVVNSLRTTMSTNGCLLIQDLAKICSSKIDPMMEIIMQNLLKVCANMKKITAQNGNTTVDIVIGHVSFTHRILQHVSSASLDKNVQLRLYSTGWLRTLINRQAHHKSSIEHGGGLDLIDKGIKKCLSDANPAVREAVRSTFWTYHRVWPGRADSILSTLDAKTRVMLEKAPANPNIDYLPSTKTSTTTRQGPAVNTPAIAGRSALKEAIAARKKAYLAPANARPDTPPTASTSSLSSAPLRSDAPPTASTSSLSSAPLRSDAPPTAPTSLSSAPLRPGVKARRVESQIYEDPVVPPVPTTPTAKDEDFVVPPAPTTPKAKDEDLVPPAPTTPTANDEDPVVPLAPTTPTTVFHIDTPVRSVSPAHSTIYRPIKAVEPLLPAGATNVNGSPSPKRTRIPVLHRSGPKNALQELSKNEPAHRDNRPRLPSLPRMPSLHIERTRRNSGAGTSVDDSRHCKRFENAQKKFEQRKRSISPRSKDPAKGREMLEKGVHRIRSKSMDILGYRKMQGLIEYHDSFLREGSQCEDLLDALLDELTSTPDATHQSAGRALDLKTQVLQTVRYLLRNIHTRHAPRVLLAILQATYFYEPSAHIFTEISATAEYIITAYFSEELALLREQALASSVFLTAPEPGTRRQATQMCVQLHAMAANEEDFWRLVGCPGGNTKNLLMYYIARQ